MPVIPLGNLGSVGIIRKPDMEPYELPPNAWSDGQNVRFRDNAVEKFLGSMLAFTPQVAPYWLLSVGCGCRFWVYAGLAKVYVVDEAGLYTNLTRQTAGVDVDYSANATRRWNGGVLSGIPILNNGVDVPQMWNPATTGTKLVALSNWPATYLARTVRPYKQFLVALDITKAGITHRHLVKWSHPADPKTVPASWDETDATKDAGEYNLGETPDAVIDAVTLGTTLLIYKENSIWSMQYVGGVWVFKFDKLIEGVGILNTDCVAEIRVGKHLVFTGDDLILFDGRNAESILTGKWKRWLRANISSSEYRRAFLVRHQANDEVWLCFPSAMATLPDKALVLDWTRGTFYPRDLPGSAFAAYEWDNSVAERRLLVADTVGTHAYYMDRTNQEAGANMTSWVERQGLGVPLALAEPPDLFTDKQFSRIIPRITGTTGGVVKVYAALTNTIGAAPSYGAAVDYTIGTSTYLDFLKTGKLLNLKFYSDTNIEWKLTGLEVDMSVAGTKSHG